MQEEECCVDNKAKTTQIPNHQNKFQTIRHFVGVELVKPQVDPDRLIYLGATILEMANVLHMIYLKARRY